MNSITQIILEYMILFFMIFLSVLFTYAFSLMMVSFDKVRESSIIISIPTYIFLFIFLVPEVIERYENYLVVILVAIVWILTNFYIAWKNLKGASASYPKILIE
ncbi:hypothetical protein [Clostridium sp. DL1XJH146]